MAPVAAAFIPLLEVAMLRRAPQDVPYSVALLAVIVALNAAVSLAAAAMQGVSLVTSLVLLVYTGAFIHGVLQMQGLAARFVQTATAAFGADTAITLVALPVIAALPNAANTVPPALLLAYLLLIIWNLAVLAHILRHALSAAYITALLWSAAYLFGTFVIASLTNAGA